MKINKYILSLLFLFVLASGFAQNKYRYTVRVVKKTPTTGVGYPRYMDNKLEFVDGSEVEIFSLDYPGRGGSVNDTILTKSYEYYEGTAIREIEYYARKGSYKAWIQPQINGKKCHSSFAPFSSFGILCIYTIAPVIELKRVSINPEAADIAGYIDLIEIEATPGFSTDMYGDWQYQIGNGVWAYVPVTANKSGQPHLLHVIPEDFLPIDVVDDPTKSVNFRLKTCSDFSENVLNYRIKNSAPHIIESDTETNDVSCYDSSDGSVTLNFDRTLKPGETLSISVKDIDRDLILPNLNLDNLTSSDFNGTKITIDGLPASKGDYGISLIAGQDGNIYYTDGTSHSSTFKISRPAEPVSFIIDERVNVRCKGGSDGEIHLSASGGGSGQYEYEISDDDWIEFDNSNTHIIKNLNPNINYEIRVRKRVGSVLCYAKEQGEIDGETVLGDIIKLDVTLTEPSENLQIDLSEGAVVYTEPTAYGFTNGSIKVRIFGGTILDNNTYTYQWADSNGAPISNSENLETQFVSGQGYFVTLKNIPAGEYQLVVRDKNYNEAEDKEGCTVTSSDFNLGQPTALTLAIEETHFISCNNTNENGDAFSDGQLTAHATGGVQLGVLENGGLPYYYTWTKKDINGVWQLITGENDSKLSNISTGEYAVNIEDKNGIVIGTYINNVLDIKTDKEYTITQPLLLEISYTKTNVFCFEGSDGAIDLTVRGGTPPFTYAWSNGSSSQDLSNLPFDTYAVTVTDSRGCKAIESIEITQPDELIVSAFTFEQPTGFGLTNGWVETTINGGTQFPNGSYAFEWRNENGDLLNNQVSQTVDNVNNQFTIRLENIGKGKYNLVITDVNYDSATNKEGCGITNLIFTLNEPDPLIVTIEESVPISCNQSNEYGNPSGDGVLIAHAKGGVVFNPGLPYIYTWKRKNKNTSIWEELSSQTDSIATNLNAGEYSVNIRDKNGIVIGEYINNILVEETDVIYNLEEPDLLQISFNKRDVFCNDGFDGWAEVVIEGGTPPYTISWNNGDITTRTTRLTAGKYEAIVTDSRGCEVINEIEINEPINPINIAYNIYGRPSSKGASDAWIEADITGGTPFDDGSYVYEWVDKEGTILNSQTIAEAVNNNGLTNYHIRLNDIVAGTYYLTIKDKNYEIADTNSGCTIIYSDFIIHEPIEATIEILTPISCNQNNEFLDPFSNGELTVYVEGGVPFSTGLPYNYYWKKQDDNGIWQVLNNQDTNIASNLSAGNYALNVEDSLGHVIGIYQGDLLIQETDSLFYFQEPELLELEVTSTPISCSTGNDGTATVSISGGISDYNIEWSNGETTPTIRNLIAGTYLVYVTDSRGCKATSQVTINQPGNISIEIEKISPICYQENNGSIAINVSGGTSPYTYLWNTGETTSTIDNLSSNLYKLQIIDAEGCNAFIEVLLEDPLPVPINLGENRTICLDQNLFFDIAIDDQGATYLWESDNGFTSTSPNVELVKSGIYKATITTSEGCIGYDEVTVTVSDKLIEAHFVLSTQAFAREEILLVNISDPIGDKVEWTLPEGVNLIYDTKEKIIISFDEAGAYDINLRSYQGDCYADFSKKIIVEEPSELPSVGDANNPFIEEFIVYPNPSDGRFKIKLSLSEQANISVKVISLITSEVMSTKREGVNTEFLLDYNLEYLPAGTYLLLLETPKGDQIRKLIFY